MTRKYFTSRCTSYTTETSTSLLFWDTSNQIKSSHLFRQADTKKRWQNE